jgi:hypothetical protein
MQLEWGTFSGQNTWFDWAGASSGGFFFAVAPNGREGFLANDHSGEYWTGRYRAICAQ